MISGVILDGSLAQCVWKLDIHVLKEGLPKLSINFAGLEPERQGFFRKSNIEGVGSERACNVRMYQQRMLLGHFALEVDYVDKMSSFC